LNDPLLRAREFLLRNARLLERRRYSCLFEDGDPDAVWTTLLGYQNPDGGFGHALEPDLRGTESEPIPVWTAFGVLDEIGLLDGTTASPAISYLDTISRPGGGVPFVLHAATGSPHAPWWKTAPGTQPAWLNPTAGLCGLLYKNHVPSKWLDRAAGWCWKEIDRLREFGPYEGRVLLQFLDHVPDQDRAADVLVRLRTSILRKGVVDLTCRNKGTVHRPLDLSPHPGRLSRTLFSDEVIERNIDAIEKAQRADGGWSINFPVWTPITQFEWRGVQTIEMLKVLQANGRLDS
jgi:hypothetical protein